MGGNNNFMSKKGWNPSNMANQVKVGEAEAAAIRIRKEEAKKEEEVRKERAQEAIKREQAIAAGRPINTRVDWMYEGPSSGQNGTKEELEAVLLGKSRIDRFVKGNEGENLKKDAEIGVGAAGALQTVNAARDIASKVREDPMLAIKRQEQAAYEKMMSDPRQRERLLQAIGGPKPEKAERKHRHHHRKHRDGRDGDDRRDHERRRTDSEDRDRRHRQIRRRSRSRTPERRRSSPGRDRRRDEPERDSRRRRSYSRSRSPPRRRRSPSDSRSPAPRRRSPSPPRRRSPSPRRISGSPPPRRRSPSLRRREISPRRRDAPPPRYDSRDSGRPNRRYNDRPHAPRSAAPSAPSVSAEEQKAEMERKLAAMQTDATELDLDREKRLAALAEREKADREAEMAQAMKAQKYGGKADFMNGLHAKAGERSLGDRIGGMKAGRRLEGGRDQD